MCYILLEVAAAVKVHYAQITVEIQCVKFWISSLPACELCSQSWKISLDGLLAEWFTHTADPKELFTDDTLFLQSEPVN